jgi:predicted NBD/HSP70 family sugar kinase
MDFKKQLINQKDKVPFTLENTQESLNKLIHLINEYVKEFNPNFYSILGIGLNLTGRINHKTGQSYSFYHFQEEPLSEIIENKVGIPTFLENDSRAMAFGEFYCGELTSEKNVIFINMDYGLGMGIMIDGKVYYGKSGFSGELGHIPLFENEVICHCGKKGCLETEASGYALIRKFRERIISGSSSSATKKNKPLESITLTDIIEAGKNEDMLSIELLAEIGEKLGRGLSVLINIFNPELLIIGGTLSETGDYIRLPARSVVNKFSLSLVNNDTVLKTSKLGEKAGVIGGCLIARNKVIY